MIVAGLMAPASVKGVSETAWPWFTASIRPSIIGPSMRRGELTLIVVKMPGSSAISSRVLPRAMQSMSMASLTRCLPRPVACQTLSDSVRMVSTQSRWRVSASRSIGAIGTPPHRCRMFRLCIRRMKFL